MLRPPGNQTGLALARGTGSLLFLVYQGWTGTIGDKIYNTDRIWGKMNPTPGGGIEESQPLVVRGSRSIATVVRGVLVLGAVGSRQQTGSRAELLDAAGRKVLDLMAGANDVRMLAPGVYFVREAQAQAQAVRKVVLTE